MNLKQSAFFCAVFAAAHRTFAFIKKPPSNARRKTKTSEKAQTSERCFSKNERGRRSGSYVIITHKHSPQSASNQKSSVIVGN